MVRKENLLEKSIIKRLTQKGNNKVRVRVKLENKDKRQQKAILTSFCQQIPTQPKIAATLTIQLQQTIL